MTPTPSAPWSHRLSLPTLAWRASVLAVLITAAPALGRAQAVAAGPPPVAAAPAALPAGFPASLTADEAQRLKALPGYIPETDVPDTFHVLPPAPSGASPARQADIAAFRETRRLQGDARWRLAAADAVLTPFSLLDDESCALGVRLDQTNAPRLIALLTRTGRDASRITNTPKDQFRQARPFVALGGPICVEAQREQLARSYAYPSGHSTYSWAAALILAEAAPDRAAPILARARAFGESRVVCGVHWVSDVEEGRTNGSILVAVLHARPEFAADLAAAKAEIASARAASPLPGGVSDAAPQCAVEAAAHTPWTR